VPGENENGWEGLTRGLASHFLADAVLCEEELRETEGPSEARDGVRRRRARAVYISGVAAWRTHPRSRLSLTARPGPREKATSGQKVSEASKHPTKPSPFARYCH
jgi:hypothetical protein